MMIVVDTIVENGKDYLKTASTIYQYYGFVEDWPTCWNFKDSASGDNFASVQFPHGIVAINPSAEYLRYIWHANMSLAEYEAGAMRHTESLSVYDLEWFAQAEYDHLGDFPSMLEEDELSFEENQSTEAASGGGAAAEGFFFW